MKIAIRFKIQEAVLACAMLTGNMLGVILCMVTIMLGKSLLSEWLVTVYMLLGWIAWLGLMAVYFSLCNPGEEQNADKIKKHWLTALKAELWIVAVFYLRKLLDALGAAYMGNRFLSAAVSILLLAAAICGAAFFVHRLLRQCGLERAVTGFRGGLLTAVLLSLLLAGIWAAHQGWDWLSGKFSPTIASVLASHIFMACCGYGAVWIFMEAVCGKKFAVVLSGKEKAASTERNKTAPDEESEVTSNKEDKKDTGKHIIEGADKDANEDADRQTAVYLPEETGLAGKIFGIVIPLVLFVILFVLTIDSSQNKVEDRVTSAVAEAVKAGYASLEEENMTKAGYYFSIARARAQALESLAQEDTYQHLQPIYREYSDDTVIAALYLSHTETMEELEKNIISHDLGSEWYSMLLRYYKEQETLTEKQELLRQEILLQCIVNEQYSRPECLFAQDIMENKLAVQRRLKDYEEELIVCRVFELMDQYGTAGGYTEAMAYEALDMAEEYQDNILLQYIACRIAGSYQVDGANHYERTVEAAARFDRLYDDGSRSREQLIREKIFLGDVSARCYDYEAALAYYEASYDLSGESAVALSCAKVYERREEYEKCIKMAGEVLQKEPDNAQALYFMALSCLKTRDMEGALDAAGRLGDLVADTNRPVDPSEENYLYVCAQYLSMTDSTNWTDFRWRAYDSLSEEQIAGIQTHGLLWDYMTAIYHCFTKKDYAAAEEAVDNILAVRDDLAMGWYLKGTIAFSEAYYDSGKRDDYRTILKYYEKAVDCGSNAPAVYFSIANVYDAMEDYENAWVYSKKVEEMLPYQDHGNDVYGISVHNKNLLQAVSSKLGR